MSEAGDNPPPAAPRPADRDPVVHEATTAIMFVALGVSALADGRPALARKVAEMARECVFNALEASDGELRDEVVIQVGRAVREVLAAELRPVLERLAELERWRASGPFSHSENT
jgi:hypothetical protein